MSSAKWWPFGSDLNVLRYMFLNEPIEDSQYKDQSIGDKPSSEVGTTVDQVYNKDHQQCSLSLVVNSGTTDLALSLGTNGPVKQSDLT